MMGTLRASWELCMQWSVHVLGSKYWSWDDLPSVRELGRLSLFWATGGGPAAIRLLAVPWDEGRDDMDGQLSYPEY